MIPVMIEKDGNGSVRSRIMNKLFTLPKEVMVKAVSTLTGSGKTRIMGIYDEEKEIMVAYSSDFPRLAIIPSMGIIDESGKNQVPSYGVWSLAYQVFQNSWADVLVVDPNLMSQSSFIDFFSTETFDLIGFSMIPANLENDLRVAAALRLLQTRTKFVIGGIESQVLAEYKVHESLEAEMIVGAGQLALGRMLKSMKSTVHGMTSFLKKGGRSLPLPELLPLREIDLVHESCYSNDTIYIITNNRCRHSCFWCSSPKAGPFFADPVEVVTHLKELGGDTNRHIVIADNDISFDKSWSIAVCRALTNEGLNNKKHCKSSLIGMDKELISELKKANFCRVSFGVESFDYRERRLLGKNITDQALAETLQMTLDQAIEPEINLILFSPFADIVSLKKNLEQAVFWLGKGAMVFCSFGLYAVPGHLQAQLQHSKKTIHFAGMRLPVIIPHIYSVPDLQALYQAVQLDYRTQSVFPDLTNFARSLLKLICLARQLKDVDSLDKLKKKFETVQGQVYVNV